MIVLVCIEKATWFCWCNFAWNNATIF